ncbi:molybdopterin molybdotransferase [Roseovarius sp. MBR-78]|uniref:molybdopterin molybdotransferase MoeA n=1 Tax=Roseovarius sp. MBR-78 TaxID=3156460 RepID=UPI0033943EE7
MTAHRPIEKDCCSGGAGLIAPEAALARATRLVSGDLPDTLVPLLTARGMVLAKDVTAAADGPPFDACAMDGYAVTTAALAGSGPWAVPLAGDLAACDAPCALLKGHALRVLTGAALPTGADAVIMQEDVARVAGDIRFAKRPAPGQNIRAQGCDMRKGATILPSGRILTPRDIAVAAASGQGALTVRTRLPVSLIATGSELQDPGAALAPGQIWNVNLPMLAALADRRWIDLAPPLTIADQLAPLAEALREAAAHARLILTSGGACDGETDLVARAIRAAGGDGETLKLAMKPGKPLVLGRIGRAIVLGLPGNPVAAYVAWQMIALPLARHLAGADPTPQRPCYATLGRVVSRAPGRREYRPARLVGHDITGRPMLDLGPRDFSARVAGLAQANGLAILPADTAHFEAGDEVQFLLF